MKIDQSPRAAASLDPAKTSADLRAPATTPLGTARDMIDRVHFPEFVSHLLAGTFEAIVDASVQQMKAYGDLVDDATQSVGEFSEDNSSETAKVAASSTSRVKLKDDDD